MKLVADLRTIAVESLNHPNDLTIFVHGVEVHVDIHEFLIVEDIHDSVQFRHISPEGTSGPDRARSLNRLIQRVKIQETYGHYDPPGLREMIEELV